MYNLFEFVHNSLGLHFWDLPTLVAAIALAVVLVVHTRNQKKREDDFNEARDKQLEGIRSGSTKNTRKA